MVLCFFVITVAFFLSRQKTRQINTYIPNGMMCELDYLNIHAYNVHVVIFKYQNTLIGCRKLVSFRYNQTPNKINIM